MTLEPSESGEFVGQVFKTLNDKFVGNLSFFRVFSGKITAEQPLVNVRTGKSSRTGGLLLMQGKAQKTVPEAIAGDIVAVAKVEDLHIGDTVGGHAHAAEAAAADRSRRRCSAWPSSPRPAATSRRFPAACTRSPTRTRPSTSPATRQTKELVITGMSQLHLDVIQHRLKRRFDLEVVTKEPKIPYRETITTQGRGRPPAQEADRRPRPVRRGPPARLPAAARDHRRRAVAGREVRQQEPLREAAARPTTTPDHNFAFIDHIVGGTIPNQFMPAVEKGCKELLERGAPGRLPHAGRGRGGLLRQGPPGGQLGSGVQDGRPDGLQEGVPGGPARCCWSRSSTWR